MDLKTLCQGCKVYYYIKLLNVSVVAPPLQCLILALIIGWELYSKLYR